MAEWRRRGLELGSGCMCDLMWRCMWEVPSVMFADWGLLFSIHNRNGFEEDIGGVLITSESVTLADVNRTSCAITKSVSLLPPRKRL
ncbi:hypothetical protein OUZ56_001646 [Daphnia magna]|uniref:Uncharacterized protein n=1 Tax=Daphnia magna TaxID=35525 RepID=A0ABR0A3A6_9CRUS|nr:hypothetical protein OUZ56_001646 [Daphnia magna]